MSVVLRRILQIDDLIRREKHPAVKELSNLFGVSIRTIKNDIAFLRDQLTAPLSYSRQKGGFYYTDKNWALPSLFVSQGELLALFLSLELTERYLGTTFEQPLRDAIQRIVEFLPEQVQITTRDLTNGYIIRPSSTPRISATIFSSFEKAMMDHHPIQMTYYTASRDVTGLRVIHPYKFLNSEGEWYIVAYDRTRNGIRQFALHRIRSLEVLEEEVFDVDPQFIMDDYLLASYQAEHGSTIEQIVLHFDAYQARYIRERSLHPTQVNEDQPDGSLIVRLQTGGLAELQRKILGYGRHVKVLSPPHLIEQIKLSHKQALDQYA